jgi:hypothetical protein
MQWKLLIFGSHIRETRTHEFRAIHPSCEQVKGANVSSWPLADAAPALADAGF